MRGGSTPALHPQARRDGPTVPTVDVTSPAKDKRLAHARGSAPSRGAPLHARSQCRGRRAPQRAQHRARPQRGSSHGAVRQPATARQERCRGACKEVSAACRRRAAAGSAAAGGERQEPAQMRRRAARTPQSLRTYIYSGALQQVSRVSEVTRDSADRRSARFAGSHASRRERSATGARESRSQQCASGAVQDAYGDEPAAAPRAKVAA